ncbi:lipoprotein [Gibbsiella quercinecans]|uniref:lipoprotein n=1 Tax=Gibbsiella quercinecans TaxID=929813 RepID=UPI0039B44080
MKRKILFFLILLFLTSCSSNSDYVPDSPASTSPKTMPDIFQRNTPAQQRSIMSGERPDWSEIPEVALPRH